MVQQVGIARTVLGFGTHAQLCAASGVMAFILQKFIGVDTHEFTLRILPVALKTLTQGTCQWVTLHLPELSRFDTCGVELQGGTHRREELRLGFRSHQNEQCLVLQRVNSIDYIVVAAYIETFGRLSSKDLLQGSNLCRGVYAQQTLYKSSFMCMVVAKCPEFPSREGSSVKP